MSIQLLQITLLPEWQRAPSPKPLDADEYNYCAIAIEDGDKYYYWAKGFSLVISKIEFDRVRGNPVLHYFSTALRLHQRIKVLRNLGGYSHE